MEDLNHEFKNKEKTTGRVTHNFDQGRIEGSEHAFANGKRAAEKWVRSASYQELKDALPRPNDTHDTNYFAFMRTIFFRSIEKICPDEARDFKRVNNDAFLNGWREGVIAIWKYRNKHEDESRWP